MDFVSTLWIVISAVIVLNMQAGFMCLEAGAVRTKNAGNVALKNLCDMCFVSTVYWAVGFGLMYGPSYLGLVGTGSFLPEFKSDTLADFAAFYMFQMAFAATAATIVSGAVAERERFTGYIFLSILTGGLIYPIAGHWIWGGAWGGGSPGWLAQMGFIDFAGATAVHSVGGWVALAAILVLGPRLGRFGERRRSFEESSIALSALGAILLWICWLAFNGGSALAFDASVPAIIVHTMMTGASGGIVGTIASKLLYKHYHVYLIINGVLAGLVAGTAGVHLFDELGALAVGATGAIAMLIASEALEQFELDDVVGAVPVHLAAGIAGTLAVPWIAPVAELGDATRLEQFYVQAAGVAAVGVWVLGVAMPVAYALRRLGLLRATAKAEVNGLNLSENRKANALFELVQDIKLQARSAGPKARLAVERSTDAGALALRYNSILEQVETEIAKRVQSVQREQKLHSVAAEAFEGLRDAHREYEKAEREDALTGLGNRKLLSEFVRAHDEDEPSASGMLVIVIDFDRFRDVNDLYGIASGDEVLRTLGVRLRNQGLFEEAFYFRTAANEFVVLAHDYLAAAEASWLCDCLLDRLTAAVQLDAAKIRLSASLGFAVLSPDETLSSGLKRAEIALDSAKARGQNQVVPYAPSLGDVHGKKLSLINDFRAALDRDEITVELQPQVAAGSQNLVGLEVLARWTHPTKGRQSPAVFLPLADELALMGELDRRVLDKAIEARSALKRSLGFAPQMAVNVSAKRLAEPGLLSELHAREGFVAAGLTFEILETAFLDTLTPEISSRIDSLKEMGIEIEVDDFGTGHASFASVLALKPDRLKIDRMFVTGVERDPARQELLRCIVDMARTVSVGTVVEGIETHDQACAVTATGADILQGYHFGKPMPTHEFVAWARSWTQKRA